MGMYAPCMLLIGFRRRCGVTDGRIAVKRVNLLLLGVLAVAIGLFGTYLTWIHNNLDTTGPVITISEELLEISVQDPQEVLLEGITAVDDRDGDVTSQILVESIYGITEDHRTTVTYAAFDRSGNVSKIQRQVRYTDYESPKFEMYGTMCFAGGSGFDLLEYVGAKDVIEGDIRRRVRATLVSDTKSINNVGSHVVRFQVTNSLGDTVEADIPVEVYDPEWYSASVGLKEYLVYLKQGDSFEPKSYLDVFDVRGDDIDIRHGIPNDIYCNIESNVNTKVPGIYEVTYTLSKNVNLMTFSGQAVLIVIVEE